MHTNLRIHMHIVKYMHIYKKPDVNMGADSCLGLYAFFSLQNSRLE